MKQPDDTKTIEMALELAEVKRGRGRPAKVDALTPAERAKRYRDAKRELRSLMPNNRDAAVTKINNHREAELVFDYTRPTWSELEKEIQQNIEQAKIISQLETQLRLAENERNNAMARIRDLEGKMKEQAYWHTQALTEIDNVKKRATELVMQYDVEHVQRMEAERALANQIESHKQQDKAKVNPLAEKMQGLKNELADAKKASSNWRDAFDKSEASQKMLIEKEEKMALYIETLKASITKKRNASRKIDQHDHVEAAITMGELKEAKAAIRKATK